MDIEVKKRLRAIVASESISNIEIAKRTGYSQYMVSVSLNLNNDTLTDKFLRKFFDAFPEIKEQYREYILEGTGNESTLFGNTKTNDANTNVKVELLTKEVETLKEKIVAYERDIAWFKGMLERAFAIYPDLQGKLSSSLTMNEEVDNNYINILSRDKTRDLAAA